MDFNFFPALDEYAISNKYTVMQTDGETEDNHQLRNVFIEDKILRTNIGIKIMVVRRISISTLTIPPVRGAVYFLWIPLLLRGLIIGFSLI